MQSYTTFGGEEPALTWETAKLRAEWLDAQLQPIVAKLVLNASNASELNEVKLGRIYKPLIKQVQGRVGATSAGLNSLVGKVVNGTQQRIAATMEGANQLLGKLGGQSVANPPATTIGGGPDGNDTFTCADGSAPPCLPPPPRIGGGPPIPPVPPDPNVPPVPVIVPPPPPPPPLPGGAGCDAQPHCAPNQHLVLGADGCYHCVDNPVSCPPGQHLVWDSVNGTFSCVPNPPPPPACTDPNACLGCGPVVSTCDSPSLGFAGLSSDPVHLVNANKATPTEVWTTDTTLSSGHQAKVGVFIGARPPTHEYTKLLSGPAPLAAIQIAMPKWVGPATTLKSFISADPVPPAPGTVCDVGGPCPQANCPDGFHWELVPGSNEWKCTPNPPGNQQCKDLLPGTFPRWDTSSDKFCDQAEQMTIRLSTLGDTIQGFLEAGLDIGDLLANLWSLIPKAIFGININLDILNKLRGMSTFWLDVACTLRSLTMTQSIFGTKRVNGLWFTKMLLRSMESITIGWDLGPHITGEVRAEFGELLRVIDYLIARETQAEIPSAEEAIELYFRDVWTKDHAQCMVQMNGISWGTQYDMSWSKREMLTGEQQVLLGWRHNEPDEQLYKDMAKRGWYSHDDVDDLVEVMKEVPPPSDVIHFLVREAFNPNKLGRAEMVAELAQEPGFRDFARAVGIVPLQIADKDQTYNMYDVPLLHWLSHYAEISPTQGYDMVHRLRPNRVDHFKSFVPGKTPQDLQTILPGANLQYDQEKQGTWIVPEAMDSFTLARLLKQNEYNPIWRARLEAISYNVLTRVDVRRMYGKGVFGEPKGSAGFTQDSDGSTVAEGDAEKEIVERYMDQGYTREDATLLAQFTASLWEDTAQKLDKRWIKDICTAYSIGAADYDSALAELTTAMRGDAEAAQKAMDLCDFEMTIKDVQAAVHAIKSAFLRGEFSEQDARGQMSSAGLSNKRQDINMRQWKLELAAAGKQASAANMCQWYGEGSITLDEMYTRLTRTNWSDADARRFLNHCQVGILAKDAAARDKIAKAQEAERRRLQSAAEKEQAKLERLQKDALAKFLSAFTDKHIVAWWKDHLIGRPEVRNALTLKGWGVDQVDDFIREYMK